MLYHAMSLQDFYDFLRQTNSDGQSVRAIFGTPVSVSVQVTIKKAYTIVGRGRSSECHPKQGSGCYRRLHSIAQQLPGNFTDAAFDENFCYFIRELLRCTRFFFISARSQFIVSARSWRWPR